MNKGQLIEMLGMRLGMDKKVAAQAVDGMFDIIVRNVNKGENVTVTGFGVFEKRIRAARTARNPRTGASMRLRRTNVPNFRPGTAFKEVVDGTRKLPRVGTASATAAARPVAAKPAPKRAAAAKAVAVKKTAAKTTRPAAGKTTAKATRPATKKAAMAKKPTTAKKAMAKTAKPAAKKRGAKR